MTQESLLRAFRSRDGFRGEASVKTWLMQIAVNVLRNELTNARLKFWKRAQAVHGGCFERGANGLATGAVRPKRRPLARQQVRGGVGGAARLPERAADGLPLLRFVEDMELLEIAAATGMKEGR